ncbi:MAG: hypothetical protein IT159_06320 [Bryobacterales bacterium]|nr:hypothetical protein [Bryobacterales bacterium]
MTAPVRNLLFWTPRIACILFAAFVSLFALDVFGGKDPWWHQILGFLIHLIPVYVLVIVLLVSWRWEWVGGAIFPGLGLFYIYWSWGRFRWPFNLVNCLTIAGPMFILGGLFLAGWFLRAQIRCRS